MNLFTRIKHNSVCNLNLLLKIKKEGVFSSVLLSKDVWFSPFSQRKITQFCFNRPTNIKTKDQHDEAQRHQGGDQSLQLLHALPKCRKPGQNSPFIWTTPQPNWNEKPLHRYHRRLRAPSHFLLSQNHHRAETFPCTADLWALQRVTVGQCQFSASVTCLHRLAWHVGRCKGTVVVKLCHKYCQKKKTLFSIIKKHHRFSCQQQLLKICVKWGVPLSLSLCVCIFV